MKDFKDSWEQRCWESALQSYDRTVRVLNMLCDSPIMSETHLKYWLNNLSYLIKKYPQLAKPF